jgi:hypothetical protein
MINGMYGEGPVITRLEGVGAGENFLELDTSMYRLILTGATEGKVIYRPGAGPVTDPGFQSTGCSGWNLYP